MITKEIMFDLPDVLSEPKVISNFFTNDMLARVKQVVNNTGMGTDASQFHTMLARMEASIFFYEDIE